MISSDTESPVTDDVEIRVEGEENTHDLARQTEQNATIDNSSNCEETDEIAGTDEICIAISYADSFRWFGFVANDCDYSEMQE